jgi:hypothetical protein
MTATRDAAFVAITLYLPEPVFAIMEPAAGLILPVNPLMGNITAQAASARLPSLSLASWDNRQVCINLKDADHAL